MVGQTKTRKHLFMYNYRSKGDSHRRNSLDYRYHLTRDLLTNLGRGECCCVVGVGSCGKSRLLLHLSRPETLEYHLAERAYDHLIVLVECNAWLENTPWAAYEGTARSLTRTLENTTHPAFNSAVRDLQGMCDAIVNQRDIAFRHLMTGMDILLRSERLKVTLCFDEFDFVFEKFDAQLFRNLRALRNAHKYQLTYLVTTRKQLPYQRPVEQWPDVEEFYELFTDNTFAIGPYDERDATEVITDLEARYEFWLQARSRKWLLDITGGHAGLLGASFRYLEQIKQEPDSQQAMAQLLINEQSTWKECVKIWDSLLVDERSLLHRMANGARLGREDQSALANLKSKGLLRAASNRGGVSFFSPIFQEYSRKVEE